MQSQLSFLRGAALFLIFAFAASISSVAQAVAQYPSLNDALQEIDGSTKPGDDFYQYANGGWLTRGAIPADQPIYDSRTMLREKTAQRVRDLIQEASNSRSAKGTASQKVGDYFASFLDEDGIEAKQLTPLADEMAKISAINNKTSLSSYFGSTLNGEVDGLTANADHIFGLWINQGFQDAGHNVVHFWQGGLGLPDRDQYLDPSPKMAGLRAQYRHISRQS